MDLEAALRAVAPRCPEDALTGLFAAIPGLTWMYALDTPFRAAHMIGQCAHESMRFTARAESLSYSSASRIRAVFGSRRFPTVASAEACVRNAEKLANTVYADRLGNGDKASGDGYRYRGRGWLQLTGRSNYRTIGKKLGIDLEADPARAEEPETAWLVAGIFLATRKSARRTAFDWADDNNVERVTRIVNGPAMLGLDERRHMTALALRALGGIAARPVLRRGSLGEEVRLLQQALVAEGFTLGALDGDFGPRTEAAVIAFRAARGLGSDAVVDDATWEALSA